MTTLLNKSMPANSPHRINERVTFWFPLLLIVVFAAFIRLYRLSDYPQRFDADEMAFGYESWSLWTTGADQYGTLLPLHIRSYNEYSLGLPYYLSAPFVGLLGLDEFSARLPNALMGIATVYLTAILGRRWFGPGAGLLAALFLASDPWHINFSRIAYTVAIVPLFTALALYTFTRFMESLRAPPTDLSNSTDYTDRSQAIWAVLCAVCFALLTLSYAPMKIQAPLLFGACVLATWSHWAQFRDQRKMAVLWIGLYVVFISPLVIDQLVHWQTIQHHFGQISIVGGSDWVMTALRNYAAQYNPSALFFEGLNRTLGYRPAFGIGELFWLEGPLWIAAMVGLVQRQGRTALASFNLSIVLGIWFATYPIASSLTWGPTSHREINFLPLPELLAGYGAIVILDRLAQTRFGSRAALYLGIIPGIFVLACFCILFLGSFFTPLLLTTDVPSDKIPYNIGLRPILEYVNRNAQPCDTIWLEPTYQAYMAYLFYTRYPPAHFQAAPIYKGIDSDGWLFVPWFDNVRIGPFTTADSQPPPIPGCEGKPSRTWFASKSGLVVGSEWRVVMAVSNGQGAAIWRLQLKD